MSIKIEMDKFMKNGAKILSDRDDGIKARKDSKLEDADQKGEQIVLIVPKDSMWNITPSFFGGMLESSIEKYRNNFWNYYKFEYKDGSDISEELQNRMEYNYNYILERLD